VSVAESLEYFLSLNIVPLLEETETPL